MKKPRKPQKPTKIAASDHVIPPAIPIDALSWLVFERDEKSAEEIAAYVEGQSRNETVTHAEKVMTHHVLGRKYECWDVRTDKARLWVITSPTNLYNQTLRNVSTTLRQPVFEFKLGFSAFGLAG